MWKAEAFDPEGLMDLFVDAGAKYFVAQAAHHDNFHNWASTHHRWNAVNFGPKKDIDLWARAARARDCASAFPSTSAPASLEPAQQGVGRYDRALCRRSL